MNKTAIWWIIALMTAALVGTAVLQAYWIGGAIQLNQAQFDENLRTALNNVVNKLQSAEDIALSIQAFEKDQQKDSSNIWEEDFYDKIQEKINARKGNTPLDPVLDEQYSKQKSTFERLQYERLLNPQPLALRINLEYLDTVIRQELVNLQAGTNYEYGIFDAREKDFVIVDKRYVVPQPGKTQQWKHLLTDSYSVELFPNDVQSPGKLYLNFPVPATAVLGNSWGALVASVIFTSLILFCFIYTITIIFRQKKLSEIKNDFINNMTHEFKTPIATISLAAESIANPNVIQQPEKISKFVEIIKQENRRMNQQVEKVLQMALLDRSKLKLKLVEVNLHDLIRQAALNASLIVEKRGGSIDTSLQADNPVIEADATHMANIIQNLLDNANKYSPEAPVINIHTRNSNNGVEITVSDKGQGISKESQKHIFDQFYRVHTGNLHDVKGFGLGLAYVKAMISAHKGQIEVKSEPGKGSSFILLLPYKQQPVSETTKTNA